MIRRCGFTLVEMLVSILLFTVVSLAMVTILSTATKLFRLGEAGRAASDEAMAVITALDDDLSRAVPGAAGGFWFCQVYDPNTSRDPGGNMVVSFVVRNPDPTAIQKDGKQARQLVTWWVNAVDKNSVLHRFVQDDPGTNRFGKVADIFNSGLYQDDASIFATGCLYLGVEVDEIVGSAPPEGLRCTEAIGPHTAELYPTFVRATLVLSGGSKNGIRGTVIKDNGTDIQVAGISTLPVGTGAMVRIGDPAAGKGKVEWVEYETFAKGRLHIASVLKRGQRRTTQVSLVRGDPVVAGQTYQFTRSLTH